MKPVGKPDAGNPHVRFDERGGETEPPKRPPRPSSTLPLEVAESISRTVGLADQNQAANNVIDPETAEILNG